MSKSPAHSASGHVMVIGNGMAGAAFLEEIVKKKNRPAVTVFGEEPCHSYNRILLSDVLACAKTFDEIHLNPRSWYDEHGIRLHTHNPVIRISPDQNEIITRDGQSHHYDHLLIATGSLPAIPPIRGLDRRGIFTFRNIEDTESMIRWASSRYRAVVIGGGLLGLEAARGLTNRGMFVTVVHLMGHLMDQQVDEKAGAILRNEIEKMGIDVRLGCSVEEVLGDGVAEQVRLTTGEVLPSDLVLITTGIRPNTRLAKEAGLSVNRGILVDDSMRTSRSDIFAVGECIEHRGRTYGLVGPVLEQAKTAAAVITKSGEEPYQGSILSTSLKVAGVQLTSMGDFLGKEEGSEELIYMDTAAATYKKLVIRKNRVMGAIFLGDDGGSGEVREWMNSQRDISDIRSRLLLGKSESAKTDDPARMPDTALVCNCHTVTKAEIVRAIGENHCRTVDGIASCTKATTGCGSCAPLVERILEAVLEESGEPASAVSSPPKTPGTRANKIEVWKKEKDGLDVLEDLHRYAREGWEKITEDDLQRLKWYGVFHRTTTPGLFMIRVRIPHGIASAAQFRALAHIAKQWGRGQLDITTRQQIQLRNLRIEQVPEILERLSHVGLSTLQTGMDNIRNVMGCAVAGLSPTEWIDTLPLVRQFNDAFVGNREYTNLPRKFNVVMTGCRDNCMPVESQDISLIPSSKQIDGQTLPGFNVMVGGKMGSGGFRAATPLDLFVRPEEAADILSQITLIYRDHGPRESRTKARFSFLVEEWGGTRLRKELESRMGRPLARAGKDERDSKKRTDHVGLYRQKQPGLNYVGLLVPVGRLTADQAAETARLSEKYGTGEIRLTVDQNLILPNISDNVLSELMEDEPLLRELRYDPSEILRGLVTCTGVESCNLAVIETKKRSLEIARQLERKIPDSRPVGIHWSGCPAGCGNHLLSDVGFLGKRARVIQDDGSTAVVDAVDVYIGGRSGVNARTGTKVFEDLPCEELPDVLEALVRYAVREKGVEPVKSENPFISTFANLTPNPLVKERDVPS